MNRPFASPQRQSPVGIFLIFFSGLYNIIRGFWALFLIFIVKKNLGFPWYYILAGVVLLLVFLGVRSYMAYRRFTFRVDYDTGEFILNQGVLHTKSTAIPFDRIQQVSFKRNLLQRVIGVYGTVVETAGSKSEETEIKALSQEGAEALQQVLMQGKSESEFDKNENIDTAEAQRTASANKIQWQHRLSIVDIIKLGLTTNYLRGIWLILIFVGSILQQGADLIPEDTFDAYESELLDRMGEITGTVIVIAIAAIFTVLIGLVISTIEIFIKFFDLKLTRTNQSLELEMGLKTNTKVVIKPRRVQILKERTNIIQKRFNLYESRIILADSVGGAAKSTLRIPGLETRVLDKIKSYLYDNKVQSGITFKPENVLFLRMLFLRFLPLTLITGVSYFLLPNHFINILASTVLIYLLIIIPWTWKAFQAKAIIFDENFLVIREGFWTKQKTFVELHKIQAVSTSIPIWYQRRGICNYTFHTAGGDISFPLTRKELNLYHNYILFTVETSEKPWM
ncbi:MAG: PH domain-containing protein [Leeuwenhoekiella sp.]